jgi:chromatin remodeling complex protein RSC6
MDGLEQQQLNLGGARLAAYAAVVGGGLAMGATVGGKVGGNAGRAALAVGLGAAAAAGVVTADKKRVSAAPKALWNGMMNRDPASITKAEVDAIGSKFGMNDMAKDCPEGAGLSYFPTFRLPDCPYNKTDTFFSIVSGVTELYDAYLMSVIPMGDDPVQGWEPEALKNFRAQLGLEDADAANAHIEVGRRLFRKRIELGDKDADIESRREFQKLVYISTRTFGEQQAKFLLPWNRIFRVSDAQVTLAMKDSASNLLKTVLAKSGAVANLNDASLAAAKQFQNEVNLSDADAAAVVSAMAQEIVVGKIEQAAELASARTVNSDYTAANSLLSEVLNFNKTLASKAGALPGLGVVNLFGSSFADKTGEAKTLFTNFLTQGCEDGTFSGELKTSAGSLKILFGMGNKEAEDVVIDVTTKVYRQRLRDAVKSGSLDSAESPASVLQQICEALQFPPELAAEVNKENYRTKMEQVMEKKSLTDEDVEALSRVRRLLCVPKDVVDQCTREICGAVYKNQVRSALSVGTEAFTPQLRDRCKAAKNKVRLTDEMALEILKAEVTTAFMAYIRVARTKGNKIEQSKEIRKMIYFNQTVVTPMVTDVTKAAAEDAAKELASLLKEATEAARKEEEAEAKGEDATGDDEKEEASAEASKDEVVAEEKSEDAKPDDVKVEKETYQKTVTLRSEMDSVASQGIYQDYLMFCMQGDTVTAPMGVQITIERDQSEFTRLAQLGDILGLNQMEVGTVHKGLADKAFRAQAEQLLGDGKGLTAERSEKLKEIQQSLQLPEPDAQRIIKGITSKKVRVALTKSVNTLFAHTRPVNPKP